MALHLRFLTKLPVMSGIHLIPEPYDKHFCNSPYPKLLLVGQRRWSIRYHLLLFQNFFYSKWLGIMVFLML